MKKIIEKLKQLPELGVAFWKRNGKYVFFGLAALFCIIAIFAAYPLSWESLLFGGIVSVLMFFRLKYANLNIESVWIRLAWAAINFGIFVLIMHMIPNHIHGLIVALLANIIIYSCSSYLSFLLGLTDISYGFAFGFEGNTRFNGFILSLLINTILLGIYVKSIDEMNTDEEFKKTAFVSVISWDKETINGNTYYIVKIPGKIIGINPKTYPEIRYINKNTKIKVLTDGHKINGLPEIKRLEIKNY